LLHIKEATGDNYSETDQVSHIEDGEDARMSSLTDDDIKQIAQHEWERYMETYGRGRPGYLNNQRSLQTAQRACGAVPPHHQPPKSGTYSLVMNRLINLFAGITAVSMVAAVILASGAMIVRLM